jgi:threonine/homoserine/homoserine lactone efflux protein
VITTVTPGPTLTLIAVGIIWETTLVLFATKMTTATRKHESLAVWLNRIMDGVLVGLGLRLATEEI